MQNSLISRVQKLLLIKKTPTTYLSEHSISASIRINNENCSSSAQINAGFFLCRSSQMLQSGYKPDGYDLVHWVRASTDLGLDSYCQQLQVYILKSGYISNVFVSTNLMEFYKRTASLFDAHKVFDEIPLPTVVSYNSLISGYVQSGRYHKALSLFAELDRSEVYADAYSFTTALPACGQLGLLHFGQSIHSNIFKNGLDFGIVVANCLIDMYGKCGSVEDGIRVFNEMVDKDIISWNSIIAATARNGNIEVASSYFLQFDPDMISYNELINGVAQFGDIEDAIELLWSMPNPNSSSWNSILTAYVDRNRAREALDFFSKMMSQDVDMDEYTFSIILSGISGLSTLTWGVLIHCCVIKQGFATSIVVVSALIDMYSKSGQVTNAELLFRSLPEKNLVTWNAMVTGYSRNGDSTKVIQLFEEMKMVRDIKPDSITFLNVLSACSHCEISLQEGIRYLESMINDYGIEPTVEHCCSIIRLMGQKGEVWKAARMIYELGFGSYGVVWRALLSACGSYRDLRVAKVSVAKVIILEGNDDYVYIVMSNLFASHGKWGDVSFIRKIMRKRGLQKEAGCSWIEVEDINPYPSMVDSEVIGLS